MVPSPRLASLFILIGSFVGQQGQVLTPCNVEDLACLSKSTEEFLNSTAAGIPQADIKPIDPMFFASIESDLKSVKYTFTNLTLVGLKGQKIADFKMDQNAKTVVLKTNVDVHYVSNVDMDFKMPVKSFSGSYSGSGKALMTSTYSYSIKPNDKGEDHFEVGKETITCEALEAEANISAELAQLLDSDAEIREFRKKMMEKREQMLKAGLCKLLEIAYPTVIHNIRAAAKLLPKTAFFKNINS